MAGKRDYIQEIIAKKGRLHRRGSRHDLFTRRVYPLVEGFRTILALKRDAAFRSEWLKYGPIGYVACIEGYFRLLIANLIDHGEPYLRRVADLRDVKFTAEVVVALQSKEITLGEFVSHLLPINGIGDINTHLSALIGEDFLKRYARQLPGPVGTTSIGDLWPGTVGEVEQLFQLRHLYAHELATREPVSPKHIETLIGSGAMLVWFTEQIAGEEWLHEI